MISFVSGAIQSGNLIFPSTTGKTPPKRGKNPAFFLEQSGFFRNQNPLALFFCRLGTPFRKAGNCPHCGQK
jgi:hypothetical protein